VICGVRWVGIDYVAAISIALSFCIQNRPPFQAGGPVAEGCLDDKGAEELQIHQKAIPDRFPALAL